MQSHVDLPQNEQTIEQLIDEFLRLKSERDRENKTKREMTKAAAADLDGINQRIQKLQEDIKATNEKIKIKARTLDAAALSAGLIHYQQRKGEQREIPATYLSAALAESQNQIEESSDYFDALETKAIRLCNMDIFIDGCIKEMGRKDTSSNRKAIIKALTYFVEHSNEILNIHALASTYYQYSLIKDDEAKKKVFCVLDGWKDIHFLFEKIQNCLDKKNNFNTAKADQYCAERIKTAEDEAKVAAVLNASLKELFVQGVPVGEKYELSQAELQTLVGLCDLQEQIHILSLAHNEKIQDILKKASNEKQERVRVGFILNVYLEGEENIAALGSHWCRALVEIDNTNKSMQVTYADSVGMTDVEKEKIKEKIKAKFVLPDYTLAKENINVLNDKNAQVLDEDGWSCGYRAFLFLVDEYTKRSQSQEVDASSSDEETPDASQIVSELISQKEKNSALSPLEMCQQFVMRAKYATNFAEAARDLCIYLYYENLCLEEDEYAQIDDKNKLWLDQQNAGKRAIFKIKKGLVPGYIKTSYLSKTINDVYMRLFAAEIGKNQTLDEIYEKYFPSTGKNKSEKLNALKMMLQLCSRRLHTLLVDLNSRPAFSNSTVHVYRDMKKKLRSAVDKYGDKEYKKFLAMHLLLVNIFHLVKKRSQ